MGVLLKVVMRSVILRRLLAYAIGCVYAVPVVSMVFVSLLRSRGAILHKKRRDKKPECLDDPAYGEHRLAQIKVLIVEQSDLPCTVHFCELLKLARDG